MRGLGVRHVAVGFDVTFGKGRTGNPEAMRRYGEEFGFWSRWRGEVDADGRPKISSTAVREAMRDGQPEKAARILGPAVRDRGAGGEGPQLGRKLGFPTANVLARRVRRARSSASTPPARG